MDSTDQRAKVNTFIIKPLVEYYGEPDWSTKGKDAKAIADKWAGALSWYDTATMTRAVKEIIETREYSNFPALSQVISIIKSFSENKHYNKEETEAEKWYSSMFINTIEEIKNMSARYYALNKCFNRLKEVDNFAERYSFTQMINKAWEYKILQDYFTNYEREYDKDLLTTSKYQKGREMIKKVYLAMKGR